VLPYPTVGLALGPTFNASDLIAIDAWWTALLPRSASVSGASGSVSVTLIAAGAAACARFGPNRPFELRACAGMRAGILLGHGQGFDVDRSANGAWLEPTLYAAPVFRNGRWLLDARAGVGVPLVHHELRFQSSDGGLHAVHRASSVVARIELGAGLAF
jgi:hypothetical protein